MTLPAFAVERWKSTANSSREHGENRTANVEIFDIQRNRNINSRELHLISSSTKSQISLSILQVQDYQYTIT